MDLNSAWVFVKVVQCGSFSGASRQLQMPVSTVSTKVSQLEERLGVSLLTRTTRKLHLTEAGSRYLEHAQRACAALQEAEAASAENQGEIRGLIRLTAPTEMGSTSLTEVVADFLKKHPAAEVELVLTDRMVDLVAEGVDLAIRIGELDDSSLVGRKIGSTEFQLYASPGYLRAQGEPGRVKDLEAHACLNFQGPVASQWELTDGRRNAWVTVRGPAAANNLIALHRLAIAGRGIALLPSYLCAEDLSRGRLRHILTAWSAERFPVHLVHPQSRYLPRRVRALMDFLGRDLKNVF